MSRMETTLPDAPRLSLVRPATKKKFDKWGSYFYLEDNLGPYLWAPTKKLIRPYRYALNLSVLTDDIHDMVPNWFLDEEAQRLFADATYPDMFVQHPMRSFAPTCILFSDPDSFLLKHAGHHQHARWLTMIDIVSYAADGRSDFFRSGEGYDEGPGHIERGLLGTGYTDGTRPSDGSPGIEMGGLTLSDGSAIVGYVMCWYNK